jgi:hypothetical protein
MARAFLLMVLCLAFTGVARADKVIMKDGKVYEGRIMGETSRNVLISNAPLDPSPRFLPVSEVLTIVRERHVEAPSPDRDKYVALDLGLESGFLTTSAFDMHATPGVLLRGGFRLHPLLQLEAELDWQPSLAGNFGVTDGQTVRLYERFYAYQGGFGLRWFPWGRRGLLTEPYLVIGYAWSRLFPKATDDHVNGYRLRGGVGLQRRLRGPLFLDGRLLYERSRFSRIRFLTGEGTFNSPLKQDGVTLSTALSWHF